MPAISNYLKRVPFIRIFVLFLTGLLLVHYIPFNEKIRTFSFVAILVALILLWHQRSFIGDKLQNILTATCILLAGIFYSFPEKIATLPEYVTKEYYLAEIDQQPEEKSNSYQTIVSLQNHSLKKPLKAIIWFSKDGYDSTLSIGDQLIVIAKPQKIRNSGNPFEFDYQGMINQRGIFYSIYLQKDSWMRTGNHFNRLKNWPEQIRNKLIQILRSSTMKEQELAVVEALTLGYRGELDPETVDYFASTGALHVLSVSGLHVALIYMILGYFLFFLKRGKTGRILFSAVMLTFLWSYAFITEFSPPVQRATVMFTFVIIGDNMRRPINIYNSLTASAFFLILLNPAVIFDVGFQLSYIAIFGIVLIQPALAGLLDIHNKALKWGWDLFTVSIAAQLTTFPLSLFYFSQFPNLFWLSNFIVIPITTLIIWMSLAFFVFYPIHGLAYFIGTVIQKLTSVMLLALKWMDALPMAVSKGFVLTPGQMLLLYCCITAFIVFAFSKRKIWMINALILFIVFQAIDLNERKKVFGQNAMIVYNSKDLMIHLINGRNNYLVTNDYNKLSLPEKAMTTKVCSHLRLSEPKILNFSQFKSSEGDLQIDKNCIRFLNCILNLDERATTNQRNIEVSVFKDLSSAIPDTIIIVMGNQLPQNATEAKTFLVKNEGSYYTSLK